jgi:acetyl-CoA acetyltransferase
VNSHRTAAVAGVGYTPFVKESGRSVLDQAVEAAKAAIADAGVEVESVDGIGSFMLFDDSVPCSALATALGLPSLSWIVDLQQGGTAPCHLVGLAGQAVTGGLADYALVFRALNGRSGIRVGREPYPGAAAQFRFPIGYDAFPMLIAMWARRFLHETGQSQRDLAGVAIAQRRYAEANCRAIRRRPLDSAAYEQSPWVVEPFRAADCTQEVDGACAMLVTTLDRARNLRHPPAVVASSCYRAVPRPGLDVGDQTTVDDYSRNYTSFLRDDLFAAAGLGPTDVDFAEIYDCFTSVVLMGLEGLGLCERGGAGELVRSGATAVDGSLPTNTNGGLLCEGYLHGMNTVAEAVLQIQGRGGERQVPAHEVGVVTSGAMSDGSAMVLTADR